MTFTINNLDWTVKFLDEICGDCDTDILGQTVFKDLEIQIVKGLDPNLKRRTVMHEVTHAFIFSYGFDSFVFDEEFICRVFESYADKIIQTTDAILNSFRT